MAARNPNTQLVIDHLGLPQPQVPPAAAEPFYGATIWMRGRIASPGMFPEAEPLPHLICSRPMCIGGVKDEADHDGGTGRAGGSDSGAVFAGG